MKQRLANLNTDGLRFIFVGVVMLYLAGTLLPRMEPAPGSLTVEVTPRFDGNELILENFSLSNSSSQTFSVTRLDMLLSELALRRADGSWLAKTNWQAFLSARQGHLRFTVDGVPAGDYDRIRFHVGVPPQINHSNPEQYPANHPLNPLLNGLHWGWAGGYVFFALEGNWRTASNEISGYSFHLGNDPMLATVEIPLAPRAQSQQVLELTLNLERILNFKLTDETSSTHSREGDELAAALRDNLKAAFSVSTRQADAITVAGAANPVNTTSTNKLIGTPYRLSFSARFPIPDLPRDNPMTEQGVELGRLLFEEKLLSGNNSQSCASCHGEANAFSDVTAYSIGAEGKNGKRNAMPIFNLAWRKNFFWDGRAASLREQVLIPIQDPLEMHESLEHAVTKLAATKSYPEMFNSAFGTPQISADRIARALEQFLFTIVSSDSKFDRAMDGAEELSEEEKRGFELFMTEYDPRRGQFGADCFHCHGGATFQSQMFANNGLDSTFSDAGRFAVTGRDADKGKFSVPSLRNIALTAPYMHDGRFETLEQVVEHYSTGVKRSETLDPNLAKHPAGGVQLSDADKRALVAYLKTLTDERFMTRTNLARHP